MTNITSKYQANTRLVFLSQTNSHTGKMALLTPIIFFLLSAFAITIHTSALFFSEYEATGDPAAVATATPYRSLQEDSVKLPIRLYIPKIKVDARIEGVGLTKNGAMGSPSGPATVAWLNLGPMPGQPGSAVIAGHYGYKRSAAAFDNLYKLRKGDVIYSVDEKGRYYGFMVTHTRLLAFDASESSVFNSTDGKSHLNLVTCEGTWDSKTKNYSNRRVVFADQVF